jgi:Flp pilus assembly protein TadD
VAFAVVVAAVHLIRIVEPLGLDQGLFACFARWVPRGWLPYRDIFDSKPPLFLYTYALAALVPGNVVHSIWWVEGAFLAASLVLACRIGTRLWSPWTGLAVATLLFLGLWSPTWGGFWSRAQAEELVVLPMLGAGILARRSIERGPLAFWTGVLTGVCGLYKIPTMAVLGAWVVTWLITTPWRDAARRVALLLFGVATPWALAVAWFAAHGALRDLFDGIFVYQWHFAALIAPPWLDVVEDFTFAVVTRAPLLVSLAAVGLYVLSTRRARELPWVASWLGFAIAGVILQRQLADYHYLAVVPPLALAGGYGAVVVAEGARRTEPRLRALALGGLVVFAAITARELWAWATVYGPDALALTGRLTREEYLRRIQPGSFSMASEEQAASYVRDHSSASDGLLVWGMSPGLYALADRHPVTRFPFHKILMTDAPLSRAIPGLDLRRAQFMARMRRDLPLYVLVGRGDQNGFEPEESNGSLQRFRPLAELLGRSYQQETTLGRFAVYRRRADATAEDPLGAIHPADVPLDWARPLPPAPPGGVAEAGYAGSDACTPCHAQIAARYARHSMARTGLRPLTSLDRQWLSSIFAKGSAVPVRHPRSGFSYRPHEEAGRYYVEEFLEAPDGSRIESRTEELTHALSAGAYGMSFYFRRGERLYQAPIDYYTKLGRWDVDAGAANGADFRFSKTLQTSCISCHSDYPRRQAGTADVFFEPFPHGVGCERCHGPGAKHVASLSPDDIVDPDRLSSLRRIEICAQCHESSHFALRADRSDFSYRPGEALDASQVNWIAQPTATDQMLLLGHPERMVMSACYRESKGALGCTSCHDPHASSFDEPPAFWRERCNACHRDHPCTDAMTDRAARGDDCVGCHMRSGTTANVPLVTITDHWIQRRPPPIRGGGLAPPERLVAWSSLAGEPVGGGDLDALQSYAWSEAGRRDAAMAMAARAFASRPRTPRLYQWLAGRFAEAGDLANVSRMRAEVLRIEPDDVGALVDYAGARYREGGAHAEEEGAKALDRALGIDAADPDALELEGVQLFRRGRTEEAASFFTRAVAAGPSQAISNVGLAVVALRAGQWADAVTRLEAARSVVPNDAWIVERLVQAYARMGDDGRAAVVGRTRGPLTEMGMLPAPTEASSWLPPDAR